MYKYIKDVLEFCRRFLFSIWVWYLYPSKMNLQMRYKIMCYLAWKDSDSSCRFTWSVIIFFYCWSINKKKISREMTGGVQVVPTSIWWWTETSLLDEQLQKRQDKAVSFLSRLPRAAEFPWRSQQALKAISQRLLQRQPGSVESQWWDLDVARAACGNCCFPTRNGQG